MECVETLCEWIIQEAEFQTVVAETLCGLIGKRRDSSHTFFGRTSGPGKPVSTSCPERSSSVELPRVKKNGCAKSLAKG